jgi:hypothetical protein
MQHGHVDENVLQPTDVRHIVGIDRDGLRDADAAVVWDGHAGEGSDRVQRGRQAGR